jgi:hypothetical protein
MVAGINWGFCYALKGNIPEDAQMRVGKQLRTVKKSIGKVGKVKA